MGHVSIIEIFLLFNKCTLKWGDYLRKDHLMFVNQSFDMILYTILHRLVNLDWAMVSGFLSLGMRVVMKVSLTSLKDLYFLKNSRIPLVISSPTMS